MGLREEDVFSDISGSGSLTPRSIGSGSAWGAASSCSTQTGLSRGTADRRDRPDMLQKFFRFSKNSTVPAGGFVRAVYRNTGFVCAIRTAHEVSKRDFVALQQEVAIVKGLDSAHVQRLFGVFREGRSAYLIADYCVGQLLDRPELVGSSGGSNATEYAPLPELTVANLMGQLIDAVDHMHSRHVCHRDISLENLLIAGEGPLEQACLKLTGFAHACRFTSTEALTEQVGAPAYRAPEVWAGAYTNLADIWSSGVVAYALLCGRLPFGSGGDLQMRMPRRAVAFAPAYWAHVSVEARGLVSSLMKVTACFRPSAADVLATGWVVRRSESCPGVATRTRSREEVERCESFRSAVAWMVSSCDAEVPSVKPPRIPEGACEGSCDAAAPGTVSGGIYMTLSDAYCEDGPVHEFRQPLRACLLGTSGQAKADAGCGEKCGSVALGPPVTRAARLGDSSSFAELPATLHSHFGLVSL
eukprot:TRINITY_DN6774_c1_g1_i1.p1 TRINITY_DN6774_c1_g1~~TRINITY_DN6774_c1_g1_i1.p1  ORF type:complete len:472 (+),score=54.36 TRINITY_DN6774_c1_g1_i1:324-1739(+)